MIFAQILEGKVVAVFGCTQDPEYWPNVIEISDDDPLYLDYLNPPAPTPTTEEAAVDARSRRDRLLRDVYDIGILMAQRSIRMATTEDKISEAKSRISELDLFAVALQGVPEQPGFPWAIEWPETPSA